MLVHEFTRSAQRLGSLRSVNTRILKHFRPTIVQSSCQLRNLALRSTGKAQPLKSNVGAYESPAGKLAGSARPILLYQATNNTPFIVGCYVIGSFLFACAIINNKTKIAADKADVPTWVKLGTACGQAAMVAFGGYMIFKPHNLVHSIKSIPSQLSGVRSVQLQVERSRSLPFIKPKTFVVPSTDITTSAPLFVGPQEQIKAELRELRRQEKEYLQTNREISPWTWPFRVLGHWTSLLFGGCRRAFTMGGLISFHIRGRTLPWKLDTESAWALEGGRSFDELVRIEPK